MVTTILPISVSMHMFYVQVCQHSRKTIFTSRKTVYMIIQYVQSNIQSPKIIEKASKISKIPQLN